MEGVIMMGHANVTRVSPGQGAIFASLLCMYKSVLTWQRALYARAIVIGTRLATATGGVMVTEDVSVMVILSESIAMSVQLVHLQMIAALNAIIGPPAVDMGDA
jgi:hypothetical protein